MMTQLVALSVLYSYQSPQIHPALTASHDALIRIWKIAYEHAEKDRNMDRARDLAVRGIGSINNRTVNWVTLMHPKLVAYEQGFTARKEYLPDDRKTESQDRLGSIAGGKMRDLRFRFHIELQPARSGGPIRRQADPRDLEGVRVVLKVGDKVLQPTEQPGAVSIEELQGTNHYKTSSTRSRKKKDKDGKTVTETETYESPHSEPFTWYRSEFEVEFPLYDVDGKPSITESDRDIVVVLIRRSGEQTARYVLADWLTAYEK